MLPATDESVVNFKIVLLTGINLVASKKSFERSPAPVSTWPDSFLFHDNMISPLHCSAQSFVCLSWAQPKPQAWASSVCHILVQQASRDLNQAGLFSQCLTHPFPELSYYLGLYASKAFLARVCLECHLAHFFSTWVTPTALWDIAWVSLLRVYHDFLPKTCKWSLLPGKWSLPFPICSMIIGVP